MKIFISWSKEKSRHLAEVLQSWLGSLFNDKIEVWFSSTDIEKGRMAMEEIENALLSSDHGIFCFTKNNLREPWIMFEAGAIFKRTENKQERPLIWSILFEGEPNSLKDTPLKHFQATKFTKKDMHDLVKSIHNRMATPVFATENRLEENFDLHWEKLNNDIKGALEHSSIGEDSMNKDALIQVLGKHNFPSPHLGDVTFYDNGFEDHPLYNILLKYAKKRLWIFGRKNKKLFDQRNAWFWNGLSEKINSGFNFKCLFLNPKAPKEIVAAAQNKKDFANILKLSIKDAYNTLCERGVSVGDLCKGYSSVRHDEVIVIDDAVLYSHIGFSKDNSPQHLTNTSFNLVEIDSGIGTHHKKKFEEEWQKATPIDKDFIKSMK
jgi:hypothetical protein